MNIDLGHPEVLVLSGAYILTNGYFGLGLTMIILGFLGSLFRAGLKVQKAQQELEAKQKILNEVNGAGEELGAVLGAVLGALGGQKKNSNNGPIN